LQIKIRPKWLSPAIEVGAGVVVGYATWRLTDPGDPVVGLLSVAVGLLTVLVVASLNRHALEESRASALDARMDLLLARLGDRMDDAAQTATLLRHGPVVVPREQTAKAWLDLLWGCSSRYWGTIYTAPDEVLQTSLFALGHSVLASKIRVDQVDARRVFIVADQEELASIRQNLLSQMEAGIQVRWIETGMIDADAFLREQIKSWPTYDVSLLDSRIVWLLQLDSERRIVSGLLEIDTDQCRRYEQIYRLLWDTARPFMA
jgi:hypothetical protein